MDLRARFPRNVPLSQNQWDTIKYMSGHCHVFAWALHSKLNLALFAVVDPSIDGGQIRHVLAGTPDGTWLVDIQGGGTPQDILAAAHKVLRQEYEEEGFSWPGDFLLLVPLSPDELLEEVLYSDAWFPLNPDENSPGLKAAWRIVESFSPP